MDKYSDELNEIFKIFSEEFIDENKKEERTIEDIKIDLYNGGF